MDERPSMTALGIAAMRAFESEKKPDVRICYDQYARRFVSPLFYNLLKFFMVTGYSEMRGPGVLGFLAARDRYIDDYLKAGLTEGIRQLVILGAGYDSRAYRFPELENGLVFEVDHPSTRREKVKKVKGIFGELPGHVGYVPIDFTTETLAKLFESGYDRTLKTMFIWQGVTYYLTPEAVDSTLEFVRKESGKGSSIVFDYTYTSVIDGTFRHGEISNMKRYSGLTGEGMTFGIPEGSIREYMAKRGYSNVKNVTGDDLKSLYFKGKNEKRKVAPYYSIVSADVC